jgi:hypothetical protein
MQPSLARRYTAKILHSALQELGKYIIDAYFSVMNSCFHQI